MRLKLHDLSFPRIESVFLSSQINWKFFYFKNKKGIPFNLIKFAGKVFLDERLANIFYLIAFTVKMKDSTISTNLDHCAPPHTLIYF